MAERQRPGYNVAVEGFRDREYPMLKDCVYLDHAGSTLCAKSLMDTFSHKLTHTLYGNPHSGSSSSQLSAAKIDDVRLQLLRFFKADPSEYDLVFVANATAGVKLVVEAMRALPNGYSYVYHNSCHTSLVGAREDANQSKCVDDGGINLCLKGGDAIVRPDTSSATLFAYSAQSHMNGQRYPLSWPRDLKASRRSASASTFTLLDAASFSATSQLDLGSPDFAADFIVLSLYKIFGFPDLGALIVRHSAEHIFSHRRYFGGGTVDLVSCHKKEQWHVRKSQFLHERLEDGTLPFHSIMALDSAMAVFSNLFGSMERVSAHTSYLAKRLFDELRKLRHGNSLPVCVMYHDQPEVPDSLGTGPVVSFNLQNSAGGWVSLAEFEKLAVLRNIHIRTGGLCSPGKMAAALGLEPWEMKRNLSAGYRCGAENEIMNGKPTGVIRASLGAMSLESDVDRFLAFVREFHIENECPNAVVPNHGETGPSDSTCGLRVTSITVYPIKSCGGFNVPAGRRWEVRPEGLAWDREWCLIHPGSGQALSQKRYPKMALLRPILDFENGLLRVSYIGPRSDANLPSELQIPLYVNPAFFEHASKHMPSRVCGEQISARAYVSSDVNAFFSEALGVPCVLARFPAGGQGLTCRTAKAGIQKDQPFGRHLTLPGSFPDIPSPPDSDSEWPGRGKILLSNESPILLIHSSSVDALNEEIVQRGGEIVSQDSFRANVVVASNAEDGTVGQSAYSEDGWSRIRIGSHDFRLLGACRRCQMVCVDQATGHRRQEPLSTLAKIRRFDGKVYFGAHMRHEPQRGDSTSAGQSPTIEVGAAVTVERRLP
ncbi:uncharacterized protein UV8b_02530 [Ustilaginoidea virens]|uniref:Molybdenum cofactor sulfurase n=1 Tax=Ustilaginoidea virens TaxID=1159556 RepID=A0A8E5HMN4_USTVR|nr:uncharacterized protein UV8b_02530 [Ustilaginoidea virens]QUC18289.1 hypothetical protein UV8b_02530 [Ustilaginoidea virens]